jgi:SAM-dependent methyltransferase
MPEEFASINWYDTHGREWATQYDRHDPARLNAWIKPLLPVEAGLILDIGAGSGRDAQWLAELGHQVIAVEPSRTMREYAQQYHQHQYIEWVNDSLPGLERIYQRNYQFDVVLLNAVWMFVAPRQRARAFRKVLGLLKPGGLLCMTVQVDVHDDDRGKYAVAYDELHHLAREHGLAVEVDAIDADQSGRDIRWLQLALRIPDDGTGALPLLRHIILNDRKSATYKLGLLRTLVRISDSAPGLAVHDVERETVSLPFGLFGLYWMRLYLPLTHGQFPQSSVNAQDSNRLGFATPAYRALPAHIAGDLRIGMQFGGDMATILHTAIKDVCDVIQKMPVNYTRYDDNRQVFAVERGRAIRAQSTLTIDDQLLWSYGSFTLPRHIWLSMMRFSAWLEPAIIWEWQKLMNTYAQSQGRILDAQQMNRAMEWIDPERTVLRARAQVERLIERNHTVYCIWSGKRLTMNTLDIDHVFPWAAWPNGDLWNLVPANRQVNQHQKRDRLVSAALLDASADRLNAWWHDAYLHSENRLVPAVFYDEARTSLAINDTTPTALIHGMHHRRITLRQDQRISEWQGPRSRNE